MMENNSIIVVQILGVPFIVYSYGVANVVVVPRNKDQTLEVEGMGLKEYESVENGFLIPTTDFNSYASFMGMKVTLDDIDKFYKCRFADFKYEFKDYYAFDWMGLKQHLMEKNKIPPFGGDMTIKVFEDQKGEPQFIKNVTKVTKTPDGKFFIIDTIFEEIKIPAYNEEDPGDGTIIEIS